MVEKRSEDEVNSITEEIKQDIYKNTVKANRVYQPYQINEFKAKVKKNRTKNKIQKASRKANRKRG